MSEESTYKKKTVDMTPSERRSKNAGYKYRAMTQAELERSIAMNCIIALVEKDFKIEFLFSPLRLKILSYLESEKNPFAEEFVEKAKKFFEEN